MSDYGIVIIGAAGFVGSRFAPHLKKRNIVFKQYDINKRSHIDTCKYLDVEDIKYVASNYKFD